MDRGESLADPQVWCQRFRSRQPWFALRPRPIIAATQAKGAAAGGADGEVCSSAVVRFQCVRDGSDVIGIGVIAIVSRRGTVRPMEEKESPTNSRHHFDALRGTALPHYLTTENADGRSHASNGAAAGGVAGRSACDGGFRSTVLNCVHRLQKT